jgi:hypothetical protein
MSQTPMYLRSTLRSKTSYGPYGAPYGHPQKRRSHPRILPVQLLLQVFEKLIEHFLRYCPGFRMGSEVKSSLVRGTDRTVQDYYKEDG